MTQTGYMCNGLGYDNEKIDLQLTLQDGFIDCMKTIIQNICDPSMTWTGIDATYFTKCQPSARQVLTLREWVFQQARSDMLYSGTVSPTSVTHCKQVFHPGKKNPTGAAQQVMLGSLYETLFVNLHAYMSERLPEEENDN